MSGVSRESFLLDSCFDASFRDWYWGSATTGWPAGVLRRIPPLGEATVTVDLTGLLRSDFLGDGDLESEPLQL